MQEGKLAISPEEPVPTDWLLNIISPRNKLVYLFLRACPALIGSAKIFAIDIRVLLIAMGLAICQKLHTRGSRELATFIYLTRLYCTLGVV